MAYLDLRQTTVSQTIEFSSLLVHGFASLLLLSVQSKREWRMAICFGFLLFLIFDFVSNVQFRTFPFHDIVSISPRAWYHCSWYKQLLIHLTIIGRDSKWRVHVEIDYFSFVSFHTWNKCVCHKFQDHEHEHEFEHKHEHRFHSCCLQLSSWPLNTNEINGTYSQIWLWNAVPTKATATPT